MAMQATVSGKFPCYLGMSLRIHSDALHDAWTLKFKFQTRYALLKPGWSQRVFLFECHLIEEVGIPPFMHPNPTTLHIQMMSDLKASLAVHTK